MSKTKNAKNEPAYTISEGLAQVLEGMEDTNWSTQISKNNVKTVVAYFHVKQPKYTVVRK